MSFTKFARLAVYVSLLNPVLAWADLSGLRVVVSNLSPATGTVEVSLFDSAESFLKEPYRQTSGKTDEDGNFEAAFREVPEGEYAVVVVHDANDNGKLDAGFLGFGGESFGYSNNVRPWFGRPDFNEVKIPVGLFENVIEITFD